MPTYQYACTACDERLEAVQSFTDAPLTECPACSGRLRKVFSAVGVVFKGSGFYKNDSRDKPKAKNNGAGESKVEGGKSDSAKGDASKSESTSEGAGKDSGGKKESTAGSSSSGSSGAGSPSTPAKAGSAPAGKTT